MKASQLHSKQHIKLYGPKHKWQPTTSLVGNEFIDDIRPDKKA